MGARPWQWLVGDDPASHAYVRSKAKLTVEAGMLSFEHRLPADTSESDLLSLIAVLNDDDHVDGILVQLPLPSQINSDHVLRANDPVEDVDGFGPLNVRLVATGVSGMAPCTPLGAIRLLKSVCLNLSGLRAFVIGRSNIVGKPIAQLLLQESCTVTVAHFRSHDFPAIVSEADIVVAAIGKPEMVRGDRLKMGAIVIEVGINRVTLADGKMMLVGDVAFEEACSRASAITPVPGGVGLMMIACLLENTLRSAIARRG